MEAIVKKTFIPECYSLKLEEFYRIVERPFWDAFSMTFTYGFALGQRYEKNRNKNKQKKNLK